MTSIASHITKLYYRSTVGELSKIEQETLSQWLREHPRHAGHLEQLFADEDFGEAFSKRSIAALHALDQELYASIQQKLGSSSKVTTPAVHRVRFLKTAWSRWAAAIILMLGTGTYFYFNQKPEKPVVARVTPAPSQPVILPGSNKAILTLSNGARVTLDSASSGTITDQALSIENKNGELIYTSGDLVAMNTMMTPKGGQYQLTLADGSRVWLNAASSITYPTAFTGKTREVKITGEAYFEVKGDKTKPFIVQTSSDQITVLGTSFNVSAYADETSVKTSLVDGAVMVNNKIIPPGQAYQGGKILSTNIKQDISWKNGYFDFEDVDMKTALRQIARWYAIDIQFKHDFVNERLKGEMGRDLTLSQVMLALEKIGVQYELKGNTLSIGKHAPDPTK